MLHWLLQIDVRLVLAELIVVLAAIGLEVSVVSLQLQSQNAKCTRSRHLRTYS